MDQRGALPWDCHIRAVKHGLICRHIVIDDLEDDAELAHDYLALVPLVSEEGQVLANSHTLHIGQLSHHLTKLDDALSE